SPRTIETRRGALASPPRRAVEEPREPADAEELAERRLRDGRRLAELRGGVEREQVAQPLLGPLVDGAGHDQAAAALGLQAADRSALHVRARDDGSGLGREAGRRPPADQDGLSVAHREAEELAGAGEPP